MSIENNPAPPGAVAVYDERQRTILRGELAGLVAMTVLALGGVIALSMALADWRGFQGWRADSTYNYAGVQQINFVEYLNRQKQAIAQPSVEALQAYNVWQQKNPQTVNVQVLTQYLGPQYNTTAKVFEYMSKYFTPGVGQSCEYCHNLENFAAYDKPQKTVAKAMLIMQFELQTKWIDSIPRPEGQPLYQLQCATCHYGKAQFWNTDQKNVPTIENLAMFGIAGGGNPTQYDMKHYGITLNGKPPASYEIVDDKLLAARPDAKGEVNYFQVTATKDTPPGLNDTYRNQAAMYHMNTALAVGCDFCHYGGYFKSYVLQDGTFKWPKSQARHMLGMVQDIAINWFPQMPKADPTRGDLAQPNCWMCHRGHVVPPGAYTPGEGEVPQKVSDPQIKPLVDLPVPAPKLPPQ
ncbi:MAG: photosynthetic reaction center cytochrome c subunit family protein [Thermoflexales bacterium]|nr:photosynthetic reaction center cytochrome c subunit family protein [Thermoflexales bacterium]MDW8350374.1 photosynthetic reaction center cytochrome c subunit family protein [Anaerolineae bacterium]